MSHCPSAEQGVPMAEPSSPGTGAVATMLSGNRDGRWLMANVLKERYDALVATWVALPEERREALLREFVVDYVYNSEKIENESLEFSVVRDIVERDQVSGYSGELDVLVETRNLKLSWDLARVKLVEDPCLSEELIQQAQELVTMGTYNERLLLAGERPGAFKLENYVGGPAQIGLPSVEVPRAVGVLADDVNTELEKGKRSLTIAAYLHARLFEIHPFADGNGRTARLLMNGVLLAMGMPPIVIRAQDHAAYHAGLDLFHLEGDLSPFRRFLRNETLLTWEGLLD